MNTNSSQNFGSRKYNRKRPRSGLNLSFHPGEVHRLIAFVKSNPCLWDAAHSKHNIRNIRRDKWFEIATKFRGKFSPEELQTKWDNLRIQFRQNHLRSLKKTNNEKSVSWKFYDKMLFLVQKEGNSTSEMENSNGDNEGDETEQEIKEEMEIFDDEPISEQERSLAEEDYDPESTSNLDFLPARENFHIRNVEDSFQTFGNYIASELRTIENVQEANRIKRKLNYLLLECLDKMDNAKE
ncbi:uncharacterized protein LOC134835902 isoform X2 [Culicoides brevitarsis]|uniref:uncharacterized protein LOC134835902 isoform X2 n=1 Tax=Culicoides brevitarsis TaxID=469753 RepID=UPI00307B185E